MTKSGKFTLLLCKVLFVLTSFHLAVPFGNCQIIGSVPANFKLDGSVKEWNPYVVDIGGTQRFVTSQWWIAQSAQGSL